MDKQLELHLTLPAATARALDRLARERKMRRAHLLRAAVERYLAQAEREAIDGELRDYVARLAPHSREFVRETESEVRHRLLEDLK
ncbi:MAG: ribbon-helix-helix protein, CopG family [Planctomycetes bacterium]|nr:ribbon-helix-helix protein, CopG family [Planctomycetota bacterium]